MFYHLVHWCVAFVLTIQFIFAGSFDKDMLLAADTFNNPDVLISELEEAGKSTIEFNDNLNQIPSAWLSAFWPG